MGIEDTIGIQDEGETCIVCEKPVRYGTGFAHLKHEGQMVTLCCPLCMETFQKNPSPYMLHQKARLAIRSLKTKPSSS
jgi:ribosomal protein L24E